MGQLYVGVSSSPQEPRDACAAGGCGAPEPLSLRSYAAEMTREVEELRAALDGLRAGFMKKLIGLSDVEARRSTVDSGTNLAGLLQHLTFVESKWFEENVAGRKAKGNRSMRVDPSHSLQTLRSRYRAACDASNEIITEVGDPDAPMKKPAAKARNLRAALLAVIEETARHAGHADIIREQLDGQTGR
jgi:hypothetical protein